MTSVPRAVKPFMGRVLRVQVYGYRQLFPRSRVVWTSPVIELWFRDLLLPQSMSAAGEELDPAGPGPARVGSGTLGCCSRPHWRVFQWQVTWESSPCAVTPRVGRGEGS